MQFWRMRGWLVGTLWLFSIPAFILIDWRKQYDHSMFLWNWIPGLFAKRYWAGTAGLCRSGMFLMSTFAENHAPSWLHCLALDPKVLRVSLFNLLHSPMSFQLSSRKWIYERFYLLCCLMKNTDEVWNWETFVLCPYSLGKWYGLSYRCLFSNWLGRSCHLHSSRLRINPAVFLQDCWLP
jgi:hypothetical protein